MRLCKCGGIVTQHALVRDREAWTCTACGRYSVIQRPQKIVVDAPVDGGIIEPVNAGGDDKEEPSSEGLLPGNRTCRQHGKLLARGFLLSGCRLPIDETTRMTRRLSRTGFAYTFNRARYPGVFVSDRGSQGDQVDTSALMTDSQPYWNPRLIETVGEGLNSRALQPWGTYA